MELHIEKFGKIKNADIEILPLTLFIGDNNAGKSYLLSLIWAFKSLRLFPEVWDGLDELGKNNKEYQDLKRFVRSAVTMGNAKEEISSNGFMDLFNKLLDKNKNKFISSIFNYNMEIAVLSVEKVPECKFEIEIRHRFNEMEELKKHKINSIIVKICKKYNGKIIARNQYIVLNAPMFNGKLYFYEKVLNGVFRHLIMLMLDSSRAVYLPAARTGFILSRNSINSVGRRYTFDNVSESEQDNTIEPFTKPIVNFLELIDQTINADTSMRGNNKIADWIERNMTHGTITYNESEGQNIKYIPIGKENELPLRTVSAVVTELVPIILLLEREKNFRNFTMCYEEPEMCLHSQLQLYMGRILIQLVNQGIPVSITTHSDIILQHINNMGILAKYHDGGKNQQYDRVLKKFKLDDNDILSFEKVAVYQLKDEGEFSEVTRIMPKSKGFEAPTFVSALTNILEQSTTIDDFDEGENSVCRNDNEEVK